MTTLAIQESRINQAAQSFFVEAGDAFQLIRDQRLYKHNYSDFDAYCQERWGYTRRRVDQICSGALAWHELEASERINILPTSERQIRELSRVEPEQRIDTWADAVESSAAGQPTFTEIQQAVRRVQQRAQWTEGSSAVVDAGQHKGSVVEIAKIENNGAVVHAKLPNSEKTYPFLAGELTVIEVAPEPDPTPKKPSLREQNQLLKALLLQVLTEAMLQPDLSNQIKLALAE